MNVGEAIQLLATILKHRKICGTGKYKTGIIDGQLVCHNASTPKIFDELFWTFTDFQITAGFSSNQWNAFGTEIVNYCRRAEKCLNDLTR